MPTHGHDADPVQGFSPAGQLLHLISGYWVTQAIYVATELGIPDLLGKQPRSVETLAQLTQSHAPSLYRVLRALSSVGIFSEVAPRQFAQSPMGALLRSDMPGNLSSFSRFQGDGWHWSAWGAIVQSVRTGQSPMAFLHASRDCFDYLERQPASAALFNAAMGGYAAQAHAAVADAYDFSRAKLIADIGGGQGALLATILEQVPAARGLLMDRPEVVESSRRNFDEYGVTERCGTLGGDFFQGVPPDADVYLLSTVLHDWDDTRALILLRHLRAAMKDDSRLLIIEHVVPEGNAPHPAKFIDLEMMLVTGGHERTEAEYHALLDSAGLRLLRVIPTAASVSILEAR